MSALDRLRSLEAGELRFRLKTGLRKTAGRVRAAVVRPTWERGHLASLLRRPDRGSGREGLARDALLKGDWSSAHSQLVEHFSTRAPLFPLDPQKLSHVTGYITKHFPGAGCEAATRAD